MMSWHILVVICGIELDQLKEKLKSCDFFSSLKNWGVIFKMEKERLLQ